jgi:hypothetical protein
MTPHPVRRIAGCHAGIVLQLVKDITPPVVLRGARRLLSSRGRVFGLQESDGAKAPDWDDSSFERSNHWRLHYTESHYYFVWTVIADRVVQSGAGSILEIGAAWGNWRV